MFNGYKLVPPFFEIGPKAYMYGDDVVALAKAADRAGEKYGVTVIFTPQCADIYRVAQETGRLLVFAPHMDPIEIGRGNGLVLPEAVKAAGASGVILNHVECPLTLSALGKAVKRADQAGLLSMVCTDNLEESMAVAMFSPNVIVAEPSELIGTGQVSGSEAIIAVTQRIRSLNPDIAVLHAAGISSGDDVYRVFAAGASATGSSSGILKAADPLAMAEEMICAARRGYDDYNCNRNYNRNRNHQ